VIFFQQCSTQAQRRRLGLSRVGVLWTKTRKRAEDIHREVKIMMDPVIRAAGRKGHED